MEYVKFNHYNPSGYIDFVPDATKKANIKTVYIIVGLSIIGILVWYLNNKMNNNTVTIKKMMLNQLEKFDLLLIVIE